MDRFAHQSQVLEESKDKPQFALFWEMGCGKSRLICDTVAHLGKVKEISRVLILAPNGVHRVWIEDEVPKWLGNGFATHYYVSDKAANRSHQQALQHCLAAPFSIVSMSYDAFITVKGKAFAQAFLKDKHATLMVLDESTAIKTPNAIRTKAIIAAAKYATYRRILTGTPVANNPFDLYTQIRFLDPEFWKRQGFNTFAEFKAYFGIWKVGFNKEQRREFQYVVAFRNLDELHRMLAPISSRVLKEDVLDLPPKLYAKRYFELSPEQKRVYRELKEEALSFLSTGEMVSAPLVITRMLRLAQVTSNYLPSDDGEGMIPIDGTNPRLACLETTLQEVCNSAIIWARFRKDIDQIMELLGDRAVRYDGETSNDDRAKAISAFQAGKAQFFVGNPAAGGMGLTLTKARTVIYYNNSFRLVDRLQSEDRAHRIGQPHPVEYIDIVAPGTIDTYVVQALRSKVDIASAVTGDRAKEWI